MDFITFLQNINSNINSAILSVLNSVLFIELTAVCCWGMYQAWTIGKATTVKITELALYNAVGYWILLGMSTSRNKLSHQNSFGYVKK